MLEKSNRIWFNKCENRKLKSTAQTRFITKSFRYDQKKEREKWQIFAITAANA